VRSVEALPLRPRRKRHAVDLSAPWSKSPSIFLTGTAEQHARLEAWHKVQGTDVE